jgi:hypothetical protein
MEVSKVGVGVGIFVYNALLVLVCASLLPDSAGAVGGLVHCVLTGWSALWLYESIDTLRSTGFFSSL